MAHKYKMSIINKIELNLNSTKQMIQNLVPKKDFSMKIKVFQKKGKTNFRKICAD